jgi:hypothetical protein
MEDKGIIHAERYSDVERIMQFHDAYPNHGWPN